jgi:sugar/nucleoside kinase (ribokinase family)
VRIPVAVPGRRAADGVDVLGVGQNTVDHLCVVDVFPVPDSKQRLRRYAVQPGGQVATALAALGRWGARTAYVGTFGDDEGGRRGRASLEAHGVDVSSAPVRAGVPSQTSVILVEAGSGERTVLWDRAAGLGLAPAEVPRARVERARVVLVDGIDAPAARAAVDCARAAGVPTVGDLDGSAADAAGLLPLLDVVLVSREFACQRTGAADAGAALRALAGECAASVVGVTLGSEGVLAAAGGRELRIPGFRIEAVDATGAGDVFHAGFIWAMLAGRDLEDGLRLAAAAAALQCTRLGGRDAIPSLADVRALAAL